MRRSSFRMSLCLPRSGYVRVGAAAEERKLEGARPDRIVAAHRIECSLHLKSGEPLDPPSTATIQQAEQFKAREHFKEDITPAADVKISWLGASFVRRFAAVKVEAAGVTSLQAYLLRSPSNDRDIIAELGNRHETSLADVWCFLRQQAKGEGGCVADLIPSTYSL